MISMRYYRQAYINPYDFTALKKFESLHPELYTNARAPRRVNTITAMAEQANAFNAVFDHHVYKVELMQLIRAAKHHEI